jgi:hypothetical protein
MCLGQERQRPEGVEDPVIELTTAASLSKCYCIN